MHCCLIFLLGLHLSEPGYYYYSLWGFEDLFIYFCLLTIFSPIIYSNTLLGGYVFWCTKQCITLQSSLNLCANKIPINFSGIFAWLRTKDFRIPSPQPQKTSSKMFITIMLEIKPVGNKLSQALINHRTRVKHLNRSGDT